MSELLKDADTLGLDPGGVAAGGLAALQTLIALKHAKAAGEGVGRTQLIARVQEAARGLDPTVRGNLLQQVRSCVLALQGRNGDTEVAHVMLGEMVLPKALQTPNVLRTLRQAAEDANIRLDQLWIGSGLNSTNPQTGRPEFAGLPQDEIEEKSHYLPNDPNAPAPTNRTMEFDPDGPDLWEVAKRHPVAAIPAALTGLYARFLDKPDNYHGSSHNDAADAYRHARRSQILTQLVGQQIAKKFGDAYERSNPNPESERLMDLYNNQVGRSIDGFGRQATNDSLKQGQLRTSPFRGKP